jgi:hypothetical protein
VSPAQKYVVGEAGGELFVPHEFAQSGVPEGSGFRNRGAPRDLDVEAFADKYSIDWTTARSVMEGGRLAPVDMTQADPFSDFSVEVFADRSGLSWNQARSVMRAQAGPAAEPVAPGLQAAAQYVNMFAQGHPAHASITARPGETARPAQAPEPVMPFVQSGIPEGSARQYGGPADSAHKYLVGEAGTELFVPRQAGGDVLPASMLTRVTDHGWGGIENTLAIANLLRGVGMTGSGGGDTHVHGMDIDINVDGGQPSQELLRQVHEQAIRSTLAALRQGRGTTPLRTSPYIAASRGF